MTHVTQPLVAAWSFALVACRTAAAAPAPASAQPWPAPTPYAYAPAATGSVVPASPPAYAYAAAPAPASYAPPPAAPAPAAYPAPPAYAAPPVAAAPNATWAPAPRWTPPAPPPLAPPGPVSAAPPPPATARALLPPLVGPFGWQSEVRAVVKELEASLSPQNRARVASVPLVFDPNSNEVNAFAGCDSGGAPFVAATEGLLEAIDALAQTTATDELYGTHTYEAYLNAVLPRLVGSGGGSAALPVSLISPTEWIDLRRLSRAHEVFDEIAAFTFAHELAHHYLGHTGCANGQAGTFGPAIAQLGMLAASVLPIVNQPNEAAADVNGCIDVLDAGRARAPASYRWTEQGGLRLLDFFARLERAAGSNPLLGFLRTHPNPGLRIPLVQGTAVTWHLEHPG